MRWNVGFAGPALRDFGDVIEWTTREFGPAQALRYENLIFAAAEKLQQGPFALLTQAAPAMDGIRCLAVMDGGRRARHVLYFTWASKGDRGSIQILRILHASMDFSRHLPPET